MFLQNAAYLTMGLKKGRSMKQIAPTDSVPEFELGNTATDIQWRREERQARERGRHRNSGRRRQGGMRQELRKFNILSRRRSGRKKGQEQ